MDQLPSDSSPLQNEKGADTKTQTHERYSSEKSMGNKIKVDK